MKTCSAARYVPLIALYLYQYLNAVILSAYMMNRMGLVWTSVWQIAYLSSLNLLVYRQKQANARAINAWLAIGSGFILLLLVSYLVSWLSPVSSSNQETLLSVFGKIPLQAIAIFLINASMVEELVYRGLLWEVLPGLMSKVLITSLGFALAHQPDHLIGMLLYAAMGVVLGVVRQLAGLKSAIVLHCLWNIVVLITQLYG